MSVVQKARQVAIAAGDSLSGGAVIGTHVLCGILMPAAWTAADLTFQVSFDDGATWHDYNDSAGNEVVIAAPAAGKYRAVDPSDFAGVTRVKVRSGKSAAAVNQAADRTITLVTRQFYAVR